MNENASKTTSKTNWEHIDALMDDEIDTSDIPSLDDDFFASAELRMPEPKQAITIRVDKEVLDRFKSQGKGYQTRMNAVLRMYVKGQST
jgi:uncharacterized protein (DUF4415 family)